MTSGGDDGRPADEEVLESGAPAKRSRTRRLREQLLLAAVVLALVAAVARAMSKHQNDAESRATPTPSSTFGRTPPDPGSGLLNGSVIDPSGHPDDPADCPATYQCLQVGEAGQPAVRALLAAFPNALLMSATTIRLLSPSQGRPLWFREMTARFGPNRILIRVQRQRPVDLGRSGLAPSNDSVITSYEGELGTYHVVVQVRVPKGHEQPLPPVKQLASDIRLLALS